MILILSKFLSQVLNNTLYYYYYWKIGLFDVLVCDSASTSGYCIYSIYSILMENKWNTSLNILLICSVSRICNFSVNWHLLMLIETIISLVSHLIQNIFAVANWFCINIISRKQGCFINNSKLAWCTQIRILCIWCIEMVVVLN